MEFLIAFGITLILIILLAKFPDAVSEIADWIMCIGFFLGKVLVTIIAILYPIALIIVLFLRSCG